MEPGLDLSFRIIEAYPDREVCLPVVASALEEGGLRQRALDFLLAAPESRAPREIIRRFHHLAAVHQGRALREAETRLLTSAGQLLRSDRAVTRENVARLAETILDRTPERRFDVVPLLLVLLDDPVPAVRDRARSAFLRELMARPRGVEKIPGPRDPVFSGLRILLERFSRHEDRDVLRALFLVGEPGADLLGRTIGERRPGCEEILALAREPVADPSLLAHRVDAIFRWLRSPYPATREAARAVLRERTDPGFLRRLVERLESDGSRPPGRDYPIFRHVRWDLLTADELATLRAETLLRIAGFLQASHGTPEERAVRIGRLLPVCPPEARAELLEHLREYPVEPILEPLAELFDEADEDLHWRIVQMIPPRCGRRAFTLLIRQLGSPYDRVRELAQRKISGQSLAFFFESLPVLSSEERQHILPILARVDLHFLGQLRRSLRSSDEKTVVHALRTILEIPEIRSVEEALFDLTVNPSARVRATLTKVMKRTSREAALHYLRLFLGDSDDRVVANAVETLGELGDPQASSWFEGLRGHPTPRVRANTLLALARLGDDSALAQLDELGSDTTLETSMKVSLAWAREQLEKHD